MSRRRAAAVLAAGGMTLLLGMAVFSPDIDLLARPLEVPDRLQRTDVVVAVSAGTLRDCRGHPNLFLRERKGAELVKQGYSRSGMLIVSGVYTDPRRVSLAACRRRLAALIDLDPQRLIVDNAARTTQENARGVQALMASGGYRDAVLVTSRSHMFRALKTFEARGLRVYPVQVPDLPPYGRSWFSAGRRAHLGRFLYEYGALIKYKWYGYL